MLAREEEAIVGIVALVLRLGIRVFILWHEWGFNRTGSDAMLVIGNRNFNLGERLPELGRWRVSALRMLVLCNRGL